MSPLFSLNASPVELWNRERYLVVNVLIENPHQNDRERCKGEVEQDDVSVIENVRAVEIVVDVEPEE